MNEMMDKECYYEIKVNGHLDTSWSAWLNCVVVTFMAGEYDQTPVTVLTSPIMDQSALRGLLNKLFDLNLILLSMVRCNPDAITNEIREAEK